MSRRRQNRRKREPIRIRLPALPKFRMNMFMLIRWR